MKLSLQYERQLLEAKDDIACTLANPGRGAGSDGGESIEQHVEGNPRFGARERGAKAIMDSHPESDVIAQVAIQPEFVRVRKFLRVAVGSSITDADEVAGGKLYARHFDLAGSPAEQSLDGTLQAQGLVDHGLAKGLIPPQ